MLFDSHSHIGTVEFDSDRDEVCKRIEDTGMSYVIDIGVDLESSMKAIKLAEKYPWCYATVGYHPHEVKDLDDDTLMLIEGLAKKPKVVAIGEIGLDYYRDYSPRDLQRKWFREQIRLALKLGMPIVIHDRDANDDVLKILKEEKAFGTKVLMHCYSGSRELARQYVKLGANISISGTITYKNARRGIEVVEAIPLEHLLIETDCPYLTPEPFRGRRNEPTFIKYTAQRVAEIKGISFEEVAETTCNNAKKFFGIE